jgi:hypothetical protein
VLDVPADRLAVEPGPSGDRRDADPLSMQIRIMTSSPSVTNTAVPLPLEGMLAYGGATHDAPLR